MKVAGILAGGLVVAVALWVIALVVGALGGWLAAIVLDQVFTIDYAIAKTVGIIVGALSAVHFRANMKG